MKFLNRFFIFLTIQFSINGASTELDCSEAYGGRPNRCEVITCSEKFAGFLGTWRGPFASYVQELESNRPFNNRVTYSKDDCLRNLDSGDTFIIGRRKDEYPAFESLPSKSTKGLLITGRKLDGSPFLRTVDENGMNDYDLIYKNQGANLTIWGLTIPSGKENYEMRFTTIDQQDLNETKANKRIVTVTLSVGPIDAPVWEGVISSGFHVLQKTD